MKILALFFRSVAKLRFKIFNLATIKDLSTDDFNTYISEFITHGWDKTYEYDGFDAWIDYGKVILKNGLKKLTFEWDNWSEGSIEGPIKLIESFAEEKQLEVTHEWRWSEYDE